ncbi:MAG: hypothetical protein ACJ746_06615 [Bryobacteraceae bacterium]
MTRLFEAIKLVRSVKPHHAQTFARTVVPEVVRPARVIWNQAIGAIFVVLAVPALFKALQLYREMKPGDSRSLFGLILSVIFCVVMSSFAIASFRKARRIASRT